MTGDRSQDFRVLCRGLDGYAEDKFFNNLNEAKIWAIMGTQGDRSCKFIVEKNVGGKWETVESHGPRT
jgi:hypothetical protein